MGVTRALACTSTHPLPAHPQHSQRLHVGVLRHVPHLHGAVVGRAVQLVGASAESQTLIHGKGAKGDLDYSRQGGSQAQGGLPEIRSQHSAAVKEP